MTTPRPLTLRTDASMREVAVRVNEFARDVIAALSRRPRLVIREIVFVGGTTDLEVNAGLAAPPVGAWVARVLVRATPETAVQQAVWLDWVPTSTGIRIRYVTALSSGVEYLLTIAMVES